MPLDKQRRNQVRTALAAIERILWEAWDPIGVNQYEEAYHEYFMYTAGLFGLLRHQASADEITRHLLQIETEAMGLKGSKERCEQVARLLLAVEMDPSLKIKQ